jgi:hypothetical protein
VLQYCTAVGTYCTDIEKSRALGSFVYPGYKTISHNSKMMKSIHKRGKKQQHKHRTHTNKTNEMVVIKRRCSEEKRWQWEGVKRE